MLGMFGLVAKLGAYMIGGLLAIAGATVTFATQTENVSLIGGTSFVGCGFALFILIYKGWSKENKRLNAVLTIANDRGDRAEFRLGLVNELLDQAGVQRPAAYWTWPPPGKEPAR